MDEDVTVLSKAKAVREFFRVLLDIDPDSLKPEATELEDQLARFRIWANNIGVFASGHASVDYRLRDSPEAKSLMIQLLEGLKRFLGRAISATGLSESDPQLQALETFFEEAPSDTYQSSQSSYVSSRHSIPESTPEADVLTPSEERLHGIELTIDRLYRLSVTIRRPSIVTQNVKAASFPIKDNEGNECSKEFQEYAFQVVTHRFPTADQRLRERLSEAITLRRKRFLYRQHHQKKLSFKGGEDEESPASFPSKEDSLLTAVRNTSPKNSNDSQQAKLHGWARVPPSQTSASLFSSKNLDKEFIFESASNISTTINAPSDHLGNVTVPPPPKVSPGTKEFECPYCCLMIPITEAKPSQWKRHVFRDLDPYVCLSSDCFESEPLFHDRYAWASHMQWEHARQWRCTAPGHAGLTFTSEYAFTDHMQSMHRGAFSEKQLPLILKRAQRPGIAFRSCPLCGFEPNQDTQGRSPSPRGATQSWRKQTTESAGENLSKHIANHLQSLALISLPWGDGGDEDQTQDEGTASHLADEDPASSVHGGLPSPYFDEDTEPPDTEVPPTDLWFSTPAIPEDSVLGAARDEWSFLPPAPYHGHDRDPVLQTFLRKLYIESSPSMNDKEGPILPCHFVPFSPNKNFFGRDLALAAVEEALLPSSISSSNVALAPKGETNPKTFAICGPGGMGKTQVAIEFVTRHRDKFDAIFWVHADDASKLSQDFNDIALQLGLVSKDSIDSKDLTYTRELVKRWLVEPLKNLRDKNSELASWLLVYDGVEISKTINEFWPYDGPGSVLATSRNPFTWTISWPLIPFTATEATDFLLQLTRRQGDAATRAAVAAVSQRLGGLPLALTQMAGVITYREMTFTEFIQAYNERESRQEFLQATPDASLRGPGYEHNLASVWALENLTYGATLLETLSMLDSDGITERLISENLGKVDLSGFPTTSEDYHNARDELLQSSLLTGNRGQKKFFVHRIVQDVARTRLSKQQFRSTFMACVRMVSTLWPFEIFTWRHGTGRWGACEELFPHVLKLKELGNRTVPSEDDLAGDYGFARLLTDAGWYHHERGRSSESRFFNDMAQTICQAWVDRISERPSASQEEQQYLGDLYSTLAEITHNRGCIASETNEPTNALHHFENFNEMMRREFDQDSELSRKDMRLAISLNELGNAYMLNRQWEKGEECYQKSIETMRQLEFFSDTNLSLPIVNLGLSYWLQGKHEEALQYLQQGLETRQRTYGSDDRESFITGRFLHALGNLKASMGMREESLAFHRKALLHYKSTLGNNHHRTADVCVKVAEHHIRLKQEDTAMALLDHALKAYSNRETYVPEKARALFKLSQVLRMMRRVDEAEETLEEAAKLYYDAAGDNGPEKKKSAEELVDGDFYELIAFWSR